MMRFKLETSKQIIETLQRQLSKEGRTTFEILSPDIGTYYSGSMVEVEGEKYCYRSLKSWLDLSNILHCKMHLPQALPPYFAKLTFEALSLEDSFHHLCDAYEKYGVESSFAKINKSGEFAFEYYYHEALKAIDFDSIKRIINLGINRGDEFVAIQERISAKQFDAIEFVGVDYSLSAIEYATRVFANHSNVQFFVQDIGKLDANLGRFDLLITIATLQSVDSNFKKLFMDLVQQLLTQEASIIMGFPNSRWINGELIYGARVPHSKGSDLSTLIKDIYFCKKYLQQHRYRVKIFGKEYIFLIATKI
jgi:hypothetical protein